MDIIASGFQYLLPCLTLHQKNHSLLNKEEFRNIYSIYGRSIRAYLYYRSGEEEMANDLTQDTFVKLWEGDFQYQPDKIKALLYIIAGGLFLDYMRKTKLEADYIAHFKFKLKDSSSPDENAENYRKKCELALQSLTEKERTVFLMNKMEGLIYKDIADCLEISVKAVEKRMTKALKKLQEPKTNSK
ncbi:RNA polymerase sigma factor [Methanococcoides sp. SA1]|nr:RNA polymerase sigma factor [Methanococcoides sp. SA1]